MNATERIDQLKKERRNELRAKALREAEEAKRRVEAQKDQLKKLLPNEQHWMMAFYEKFAAIGGFYYAFFNVPAHRTLLLRCGHSIHNLANCGWYCDHCDGPEHCGCLADALIAAEYTV